MDEQTTQNENLSFLVADCGGAQTTVALFDTVGGLYRLLARAAVSSTNSTPWLDISQGVLHAIRRIEKITGRKLLNERGSLIRPARANGMGVDHFALVSSAPPPLRTILVGLAEDISLASARKALQSIYADLAETISLADSRTQNEQIGAIVKARPDLILITGGTDNGAAKSLLEIVETVSIAIRILAKTYSPQVIYAGNIKLREEVTALLGEFTHLQMADNVRPSLDIEQLGDIEQLTAELHEDLKTIELPGIAELREWNGGKAILPTARAFGLVLNYVAALQQQTILGVDLGSNNVTLTAASPTETQYSIRADLGLGKRLRGLVEKIDFAAVQRWIPEELDANDVANFMLEKSLHPYSIPQTELELHLEQALGREIITAALQQASSEWNWPRQGPYVQIPPFSLLVARGTVLSHAPRSGQAVLILLDALQPTGVFAVALDREGVFPMLGALAPHVPLAVVQALESGILQDVGWVIAPSGRAQPGKKALQMEVLSESGGYQLDIEYGALETVAIPAGEQVTLQIKPMRGVDIGFGKGQPQNLTFSGETNGKLVVIDARGRPLPIPDNETERRRLVRKWLWDMGG